MQTPDPRAAHLTPLMLSLLLRMERAARPALHQLSADEAKAAYERAAGVLELPLRPLARVQDLEFKARDGHRLAARLFAPSAASQVRPLPALLYFHGGGFTVGSLATHGAVCRELAALSGAAVVSLDYRLAPEHKFPTAAEDAWDALQELHQRAPALGLDPNRLAVGGDSAGGTLAAVAAIEARDAGLALRLQLLIYPGCAGHGDSASQRQFAQGYVLEGEHIDYFFDHYLRSPADRNDWRFAPLDGRDAAGDTRDLEGVAPAWIGLAECDPLVDEGIAYGDRLRLARVAVDLVIYQGVVHGFLNMGRVLPEARAAHRAAAQALRCAWGWDGPAAD